MYKLLLHFILIISFTFSSTWVEAEQRATRFIKPSVISSNIEESFLHFEFSGYHTIEVETLNGIENIIDLEGGSSILKAGTPDLDHWTSSIIIPDEGTTSVEVVSSSYHDFYNISVAPSKGNLSRMVNPNEVPYEYSSVYQSDEFFPGTLAELRDPYIVRDLRGQTVVVYPLQYNPITKTLRLYTQIDLKITTVGSSGHNALHRGTSDRTISKEYDAIYQGLFLNYNNDTRFDYILDEGSMLVISHGDFMDEVQPLVDWKNRKGIPTEMVNVSDIGSSSSAIESFVDNYYYDHGLTYLLLVGDIAQIPSPSVSGSASDPSYGFISGNDSYSEILVGRFSGNNPAEISTQVERSIEYELNPQSGASWYDNALGVASNQGPGWGGLTDDDFNDMLWDDVLSSYTYDSYEGIYDGSGGTVTQGINAINNGVSIINYTGHGWTGGWGNGAPLDNDDVDNLVNNNKLPFVITVGCNVGEFDAGTVFSEAWMRATNNGEPTGAIVHVGSTISQSWEPPMHGQYGMNLILTEQFDSGVSRSIGGIFTNGCMYMNDAQGGSGINETNYWTFFGDPSVVIRTDQPEVLNPIHDDVILIGQTEFVVDLGVDEGLVALSNESGLIASEYIEGGVAVLSLEGMEMIPGILDLVITSFNSFTYESEINVVSPDGAYLLTTGYELVSESGLDYMVSFGDNVQVNILTENVGTFNTSAILVEVTTSDEYITITEGSTMIAYAIVNEETITETPISFTVAGNVPDGHMASFNVLYDSGEEDQWEGNFSIEIHSTDFQVLNPVFIDADQNGVLDPGESGTLTVDLANLGSADFGWYPGAYITSNSEYIEISENDSTWFYAIGAEMIYDWTFELQATPETPLGATATVSIFWGASSISSGWCEGLIGGCQDPVEFIYTLSIGLPFDDQLAIPENIVTVANQDHIEVTWDEPVLFDCDAEVPYNDECAQYVVEIDTYCCDFNWDWICEDLYLDCMGGRDQKDTLSKQDPETGRGVQPFDIEIFNLVNSREITGYNIFRNDDFIGSSTVTVYEDFDIQSSTEYCYYVTAMYETGQSYGSEESCVTSLGMAGDTNGDENIDVLDVIIMVNMIFGSAEPNYQTADLNGDDDISILDVIILIGIILDQ